MPLKEDSFDIVCADDPPFANIINGSSIQTEDTWYLSSSSLNTWWNCDAFCTVDFFESKSQNPESKYFPSSFSTVYPIMFVETSSPKILEVKFHPEQVFIV